MQISGKLDLLRVAVLDTRFLVGNACRACRQIPTCCQIKITKDFSFRALTSLRRKAIKSIATGALPYSFLMLVARSYANYPALTVDLGHLESRA